MAQRKKAGISPKTIKSVSYTHLDVYKRQILIRIESKAGHGAGKPTSKRIDEEADTYAFLFQNIGVPYKPVAK